MARRFTQKVVCIATCLSLSSGVLLIGQLVAWVNMVQEVSLSESSMPAFDFSVLELELCGVCVVIREENREQSESGKAKEKRDLSSPLLVSEVVAVTNDQSRRILQRLNWANVIAPLSLSLDVLKPPPRIEV